MQNPEVVIFGLDKLRAKAQAIQAAQEQPNGCSVTLDGERLCAAWKVPVTESECTACHAGDVKAKVSVINRAIAAGVHRRRVVQSCQFYGQVVGSRVQPCCGGQQQVITRFICTCTNLEVEDAVCYTCGKFKEKIDAGA